ncbi:MAG TPA: hypothetical protein VLG50_01860 [Candidatus Saccharimonadales bacterium]|nr:hypothetical protein [Candidatus Saccharimonadales bacterium]
MKKIFKHFILLSSLLLLPMMHTLHASTFIPQSLKATMATASARVKKTIGFKKAIGASIIACSSAVALKHYNEQQHQKELQQESLKFLVLRTELQQEHLKFLQKAKQEMFEYYGMIPCTDPELLQLFNTIKHDMGITDDIPFYLHSKNHNAIGLHFPMLNPDLSHDKMVTLGISLHAQRDLDPISLIQTIAHELGHYLQYNDDFASYQAKSKSYSFFVSASEQEKKEDSIKKEMGADAHAAGYQDCRYCLEHMSLKKYRIEEYISFLFQSTGSDSRGYLTREGLKPYLDRAIENNWKCPAHQKSIFAHFFPKKFKPKDFLPVKDRSNYPEDCIKNPSPFELLGQ